MLIEKIKTEDKTLVHYPFKSVCNATSIFLPPNPWKVRSRDGVILETIIRFSGL